MGTINYEVVSRIHPSQLRLVVQGEPRYDAAESNCEKARIGLTGVQAG